MSRYIDADKLWNDRPQLIGGESLGFKAGFSECMWGFSTRIKEQISHPTADVVEVVRCKDCKYNETTFKETGAILCRKHVAALYMGNDHYCSYGERSENGT